MKVYHPRGDRNGKLTVFRLTDYIEQAIKMGYTHVYFDGTLYTLAVALETLETYDGDLEVTIEERRVVKLPELTMA